MKKGISAALAALLLASGLLSPAGRGYAAERSVDGRLPAAETALKQGDGTVLLKAFTDVGESHWAAHAVERWSRAGLFKGYGDGTFRPGGMVTKAEFAAILNRVMNYGGQAAHLPADVPAGAWYRADMAKALAAGYLQPGADGRLQAGAAISRGELALALQAVLKLKAAPDAPFSDLQAAAPGLEAAVGALTQAGLTAGYPDGTFRPEAEITRAELAALLDRAVQGLIHTAGETALDVVNGNAVLNAPGAVLADTVVKGNLYLSEGIGEGDAGLKRVTVDGTLFVRGGGPDSVVLEDSTIGRLEVAKPSGKVRVHVAGTASIGEAVLAGDVRLEAEQMDGSGIGSVTVAPGAGQVELKGQFGQVTVAAAAGSGDQGKVLTLSGHFEAVEVKGKTVLKLADNAKVAKLTLGAAAKGSAIEGSGEIAALDNAAEGVTLGGKTLVQGASQGVKLTGSAAPGQTAGTGGQTGGGPSVPGPGTGPETPAVNPWTLVWSDEFNSGVIDPDKWTYDIGDGSAVGNPGWGNNELQYYTDEPDNVKVENGKLVITARKEEREGKPYTSTRIKTKGLFSQTYGKYEIRAKAPVGKGLWPAIWMLPEDYDYGVWAASGEIDIMEGWGSRPDTVAGTLHYGGTWPDNIYTGEEYKFPNGSSIADFHTYAIEWEPGEIRWYVDGVHYSTQNDWYSISSGQPANNAFPAPFNRDFHLLMNLAVGGDFDGNPEESTPFPSSFEIDYVRVYELTGRPYREPLPVVIPAENYPAGSRAPLPDGNLVYNSEFGQTVEEDEGLGIPGTAYWTLHREPDAAADLSLEPIDGTNFLKTAISRAGSQLHSVQPMSIVSLAKGRYYKLSFDAKTDTERNILVRLTGGENRGYVRYSGGLRADLTGDITTYSTMFQMKEDGDPKARIEFNFGTNDRPVWIGNVRLEEIDGIDFPHDDPKTPLGDGNHLYNGTFSLGEPDRLSFWHVESARGAQVTAKVNADDKLELKIRSGQEGSSGEAVLRQKGLTLLGGHDYRAAFDVDVPEHAVAVIELHDADGGILAGRTAQIVPGANTISVDLKAEEDSGSGQGQFVLKLAGTNQVTLDNISLVRTSFYYDPDMVYYPLLNGSFDDGAASWTALLNLEGGNSVWSASSGEAVFDISSVGSQPYSIMLLQSKLAASRGTDYVLEFDASSSLEREIRVSLENAGYKSYFSDELTIGPDVHTYRYEYRQTENEMLELKFLLGNLAGQLDRHSVTIDNVKLHVKNAPAKPQELSADTAGNRVGESIELTFRPGSDWSSAITGVKVDGVYLAPGQYEVKSDRILIGGEVFAAEGRYRISVEATGYVPAAVTQVILASGNNRVVNGGMTQGMDGWATWSGEGGAAEAAIVQEDGNAALAVTIQSSGTAIWHTQLFQEDILLEAGRTYELRFKAKSTLARPVTVEYSDTSFSSDQQKFDLTEEWASYSRIFTAPATESMKLNFLIGHTGVSSHPADESVHTMYWDDISIMEISGGGNPPGDDPGTPGEPGSGSNEE